MVIFAPLGHRTLEPSNPTLGLALLDIVLMSDWIATIAAIATILREVSKKIKLIQIHTPHYMGCSTLNQSRRGGRVGKSRLGGVSGSELG